MDNIKSVVDVLASAYAAYKNATANGQKLTAWSLFQLGPVFMALPNAINNFKAAIAEAGALSEEQVVELEAYINEQLPAGSDKIAQYIRMSVDAIMKGVACVEDVVAIVKLAKPDAFSMGQPKKVVVTAQLEAPMLDAKVEPVQSAGH